MYNKIKIKGVIVLEQISVIIPVYNVEQYLEECIDSVIRQTYKNIKIIIVDDCSTDRSGELCDQYLCDQRVTVLHLPYNVGLSGARNAGLELVDTEYVTFADADDFVALDHIEKLYDCITKHKSDIAVCDIFRFYDNKNKEYICEEHMPVSAVDSREAVLLLYKQKMHNYMWNKLFKSSLFENVRFPVGRAFEDVYVMHTLLEKSGTVSFNGTGSYYYRQRENSITNSKKFREDEIYSLELTYRRIIADKYLTEAEKNEYGDVFIRQGMGMAFEILFVENEEKGRKGFEDFWNRYCKKIKIKTWKIWIKVRFPRICAFFIKIKKKKKR